MLKTDAAFLQLADVLENLYDVHPGLDLICQGIAQLMSADLGPEATKVIAAHLAADHDADVIAALALLIEYLTGAQVRPDFGETSLCTATAEAVATNA